MPTREQVRAARGEGLGYRAIGERFGIPAGQAYLIGTGRAADGAEGDQSLTDPPVENPTGKPSVRAWIRCRAGA